MQIYDGDIMDTSNFISDRYIKVNSCGVQNSRPGQTTIRREGRKDHHILLISSGECLVTHGSKTNLLTAGDMAFYSPGEPQKYIFTRESSSLWCHFCGKMAEELLLDCGIKNGIYKMSPSKKVTEAFLLLIGGFGGEDGQKCSNLLLIRLLLILSEAISEGKAWEDDPIRKALTYISENYNRKLSLAQLARLSGYSESRFSHVFSKRMGISPMKYQREIQLRAAKELLSSSDMTISEVAYSCGFEDPLYFSRSFRKKYNIPPTQCKKGR